MFVEAVSVRDCGEIRIENVGMSSVSNVKNRCRRKFKGSW
jgi:hypothetical protein